eukprot:5479182-Amphidinium_carterae.2
MLNKSLQASVCSRNHLHKVTFASKESISVDLTKVLALPQQNRDGQSAVPEVRELYDILRFSCAPSKSVQSLVQLMVRHRWPHKETCPACDDSILLFTQATNAIVCYKMR